MVLISSFLVGCGSSMPEFPKIEYVYEVDTDTPACAKYKVSSYKPFVIEHVEDLPISSCNTHAAMTYGDFIAIKNWKEDAEDWAEKNKKCFK